MESVQQCFVSSCSLSTRTGMRAVDFTDVCRSVKQEVVIWFTYNIHIPLKYSPPLHTPHSSCLYQGSKAFWQWDEAAFVRSWSECRKLSSQSQPSLLRWGGTAKSHMEPSRDYRGTGPEPGCFAPSGRSQWPWLCGLCSALGSIFLTQMKNVSLCNDQRYC